MARFSPLLYLVLKTRYFCSWNRKERSRKLEEKGKETKKKESKNKKNFTKMVEKGGGRRGEICTSFFRKNFTKYFRFFLRKVYKILRGLGRRNIPPGGILKRGRQFIIPQKREACQEGRRKYFIFSLRRVSGRGRGGRREELVMTNRNDPVLKWNMLDRTRQNDRTAAGSFSSNGRIFFFFHSAPFLSSPGHPFLFTKNHPLLKRSNLPV